MTIIKKGERIIYSVQTAHQYNVAKKWVSLACKQIPTMWANVLCSDLREKLDHLMRHN